MKIKKGDTIIVLTGKDRGKEGSVLRAFPKKHKVLVDGVNIVTSHQKSTKRGSRGQIIQKSVPIPVANVGLKDPKTGKPVRIGYSTEEKGGKIKKIRVARPSGEKI